MKRVEFRVEATVSRDGTMRIPTNELLIMEIDDALCVRGADGKYPLAQLCWEGRVVEVIREADAAHLG